MTQSEGSTTAAMSKRRFFVLLGLWALAVGAALLLAEFLSWWQPLIHWGAVIAFSGILWLVISPFANNESMSRAYRRHQIETLVIMVGYVIGMSVFAYVSHIGLPVWARALSALLPVLPILLVVRSLWLYVRDSDELERRVQMEAIIIASSVTVVLTFLAGWLQMTHVLQFKSGLLWVLPLMALSYAVGWRRRKYGIRDWC